MPEFRKGPMVDRWIIVSTEHSCRPSDVQLQPKIQHLDVSPFHPCHEAMTPPKVLAYRTRQTALTGPAAQPVRCQMNILPFFKNHGAMGGGTGATPGSDERDD
jgi:galactose-1-phosphate uridylyltransferase